MPLTGLRVLVTGGTGSLGSRLVERLLAGHAGSVDRVLVLSRDEEKQHAMRQRTADRRLETIIGDVRDARTVAAACGDVDAVIHAAALKQVPGCESYPLEAVATNVLGTGNVVAAACAERARVVVLISTDKAVKPVSVMGATKAIAERIVVDASVRHPATRCVCVRYGNVMGSRGSLIPVVRERIARGEPVTVTDRGMTRFMFTLDAAVDTVFHALRNANTGETIVPRIPSSYLGDVIDALVGGSVPVVQSGPRPGEKTHEEMVCAEEAPRTRACSGYYAIVPSHIAPCVTPALFAAYSSADAPMSAGETRRFLDANGVA